MMNQDQIVHLKNIIQKNPFLIWYTHDYNSLNEEAIAEALYNYGSWNTILELHKTVGLSYAKNLFYTLKNKPRSNLRPIVRNYFTLYYDRHPS